MPLLSFPRVYYTKDVSPNSVLRMFRALNINLPAPVAVKVHSGEAGNQNFLGPEMMRPTVEAVHGTIAETVTAYEGARSSVQQHLQVLDDHGWSKLFNVDLLDRDGHDLVLPIVNGRKLRGHHVGGHLVNYNSMLVLSHFKGHPVAGYGGALKQLAIGCASVRGKALIHSGGLTADCVECWSHMANPEDLGTAMAEAAGAVLQYFSGRIAFVNIAANLSVDCDCCAVAEDPCMSDIGVLASLDPVALDKACLDLVERSNDAGKRKFLERVESRKGRTVIDVAYQRGIGSNQYMLIRM